jgi:hypothetical protein
MKCSASTNEYNQHSLDPEGKPGNWEPCANEATTAIHSPKRPVCDFHAEHFVAVAQRTIDALNRGKKLS